MLAGWPAAGITTVRHYPLYIEDMVRSSSMVLYLALRMPAVTVKERPNGVPIASTESPTFKLSGSSSSKNGSAVA